MRRTRDMRVALPSKAIPIDGVGDSKVGQLDSNAIAPLVQEHIAEIILGLNRERGLSILMIEHNVHMTLEMAHWVYILETGRVHLKGKPDDLSKSEYVQKIFLAD